jgi:AraC-like DNA-binding protein
MSKTLSVSSFNLILFTAQQKGADYDLLCQKMGLEASVLQNPDGRLPIPQVQRLWKEAVDMTGDEHLALHLGESINTIGVGILAYVMMHCPTFGKALEKLCQYQDIVCDGSKTTLTIKDDLVYLELTQLSDEIIYPHYAFESELSIYYAASKAMIGISLPLKSIQFSYPQYADIQEYKRIFQTDNVIFDSKFTGMVFDKKYLETTILNANPSLFSLFEIHAKNILSSLKSNTSIAEKVKKEPTLSNIAKKLGIGVRSIQLKLKEEGVTFQQLLEEIRKNLATKHLKEDKLSTTDIAYLLGYSEPSVFFRSFKKWTGQTPTFYRKSA